MDKSVQVHKKDTPRLLDYRVTIMWIACHFCMVFSR